MLDPTPIHNCVTLISMYKMLSSQLILVVSYINQPLDFQNFTHLYITVTC